MRILLWSDGDRARSAAAREWFYDMCDLLRQQGIDAELNVLGKGHYDIALIQWPRLDRILQVQAHSPNAHIGVLNPGNLGFPREYVRRHTIARIHQIRTRSPNANVRVLSPAYLGFLKDYVKTHAARGNKADVDLLVANVDFFVVSSFMWREILLPFGRRVYQVIDYVKDLKTKRVKVHAASDNLVIGYHGNELHFARDFFPRGARALQRLAKEHNVTLKVVTSNVQCQPRIPGVRTASVEWQLDSIDEHLQSFDIGICPSFSDMSQLLDPFTHIRNPNRVISLLAYGIPSVTSPVFENCSVLANEETALFAVIEEGWYDSLKRLITQPDLRNQIGRAGRQMVERAFSEEAAASKFRLMLEEEMRHPIFPKSGALDGRAHKDNIWRKIHWNIKALR